MIEQIFFYAIGGIALFVLGRMLYRQYNKPDKCAGCMSKGNCSSKCTRTK
ncbi:MAG: hypothetical protein KKF44_01765 [Nanoarchaeota archaeon]|nr:hypothetical protein [Nanoarchaeota archaeon]